MRGGADEGAGLKTVGRLVCGTLKQSQNPQPRIQEMHIQFTE